jgi:hypothetical protein
MPYRTLWRLGLLVALLPTMPSPASADRGGGHGGWHHGGHHGCCRGGTRFFLGLNFGFPFYPAYPYYPPAYYYPPSVVYTLPPVVYAPPPVTYQAPQSRITLGHDVGQGCREYTAPATVGGQIVQSYGIACPRPDGSWQIVN